MKKIQMLKTSILSLEYQMHLVWTWEPQLVIPGLSLPLLGCIPQLPYRLTYPHSGLSFSLAHPSFWNLQHWRRTFPDCPTRLSSLHTLCLGHIFFSLTSEKQTYKTFILHMSSVFVTCMNEINDLYSISGPQKAMVINWSNLQWRISD